MGVLRWQSALDAAFSPLLSIPLRKLDLEVLIALRMGVYQLAFLSRTPGHAIVNETVELVKYAKKRSAAGLVNAVMRKLQKSRQSLSRLWKNVLPTTRQVSGHEFTRAERTSVRAEDTRNNELLAAAGWRAANGFGAERLKDFSFPQPVRPAGKDLMADFAHPEWLVTRWIGQFGHGKAEQICRYDQQVPATALRINSAADEDQLRAEGIELASGALMKNARIVTAGDVTKSELFRSGRIAIQDEGSQLVAALVGNGKRILDCCAAPGSKTGALATALPEAEIFAAEIHPHRARLLRQMVLNKNVQVITADALHLPYDAEFDRVLADVPCSGTGTLARNPEIKWRLQPEDIADLQSRQIAIVTAALKYLAPGGRLVYSTCSLEVEEDEQVVSAVLRANPEIRLVPVKDELERLRNSGELVWKNVNDLISGDYLRTFPGTHPCDGFFAAVLEKS
jgi:16S rRNA (cytosine967-C5)-methyltransferase